MIPGIPEGKLLVCELLHDDGIDMWLWEPWHSAQMRISSPEKEIFLLLRLVVAIRLSV